MLVINCCLSAVGKLSLVLTAGNLIFFFWPPSFVHVLSVDLLHLRHTVVILLPWLPSWSKMMMMMINMAYVHEMIHWDTGSASVPILSSTRAPGKSNYACSCWFALRTYRVSDSVPALRGSAGSLSKGDMFGFNTLHCFKQGLVLHLWCRILNMSLKVHDALYVRTI